MRNPLAFLTAAEIDDLYLDPERLALFAKWANEQVTKDLESLDKEHSYQNESAWGDALFVKYIKQYAMKELTEAIFTACDVIQAVGPQVLSPKAFQDLLDNWDEASDLIAKENSPPQDETRSYAQILKLKESSLESIVLIGEHEFREKEYENALDIFFFLTLIDPAVAEFPAKMGIVLSELDRHEEAIQAFNKSIAINPDNIEIRLLRLLSLIEEGQKDLVLEELSSLKQTTAAKDDGGKWKKHLEAIENCVMRGELHGHS